MEGSNYRSECASIQEQSPRIEQNFLGESFMYSYQSMYAYVLNFVASDHD